MTVPGHVSPGTWRHPDNESHRYNELSYWVDLARLLEAGGFDGLFIADTLGHLDVYGESPDASLRTATQSPLNDPLLAVSAMAAATEHLGFGITVSTTYEYPYLLARKFTTLDHLTGGRIAWNIVTTLLESAARNLGLSRQIDHDQRYDQAQEFLEVSYKLWEASWEDDAVRRDKERGVFTDPAKVHPIGHDGEYYTVPGPHLSEPSPQRTPVLFQAGTSARGKRFAAQNAELVFLHGSTPREVCRQVGEIKQLAREAGRAEGSIKFITSVTVVTGPDDTSAQAKFEDYSSYLSDESALVLFSAFTGVDWSRHDPDEPLRYIETNASRSLLTSLTGIDAGREWKVRDVGTFMGIGSGSFPVIGGPTTVADRLEEIAEEGDLDGFNVAYVVVPGSFADFISYVTPELRSRGRIRERYQPGTLRQKLFGAGPTLPHDHPGAAFRRFPALI
jgi:FMN-dependent oxidoreductase (nitrilotriacetate monooxygenase family)